jgi:hypothetical protein
MTKKSISDNFINAVFLPEETSCSSNTAGTGDATGAYLACVSTHDVEA